MFSRSGFHVFPLGASCFPCLLGYAYPQDGKWGKELRFEGLAKGEQRL